MAARHLSWFLDRVRRGLDDWFGTAGRYAGLVLLVYSVAIDRLRNPALLPAATGLMFLKNITGSSSDKDRRD